MTHFDADLDFLRHKLLAMSAKSMEALNSSMRVLLERDIKLAQEVQQAEAELDRFEKEIDEDVVRLLSQAPLASQLRLLVVIPKVIHDLERIGDEATTITRRSCALAGLASLEVPANIPRMRESSLRMLQGALQAFFDGNTDLARQVIKQDVEVDDLNRSTQLFLEERMTEFPSCIRQNLHLMTISKAIERIGDHAKNIAEDAVYLHEAEDIRHLRTARRV